MNKKIVIIAFILAFSINLVANNQSYISETASVDLSSSELSISSDGREAFIIDETVAEDEYTYDTVLTGITVEIINKIPFLVDSKGSKLFIALEDINKKTLYLQHKDSWSFHGQKSGGFFGSWSFNNITVENNPSYLIEANFIFSVENLNILRDSTPYVEGKKDYGVGEVIKFNGNGIGFYIYNGFVSFDNPSLYTDNSRLKKIKILHKDEEEFITLEDSPNPTFIELSSESELHTVELEILEVYKGLKYKDTCINGIFFVSH